MKAQTQKIRCRLLYSTEELFNDSEKKPTRHYDIVLTDIKYHQIIPRQTPSLIRQAEKSMRSGKLNRVHSTNIKAISDNEKTVEMSVTLLDNHDIERIKARSIKENRIIRVLVPENGLPIYAGKDAVDFIRAHPDLVQKMQRLDGSKKRRKV